MRSTAVSFGRYLFPAAGLAVGAAAVVSEEMAGHSASKIVDVVLLLSVLTALRRFLLPWRSLVALIVVVIFFIPIGRYTLPTSLPFQLEPYRLLIIIVGAGWVASLLIDRRVRMRKSPLDTPILVYMLAIVLSLLMNAHRVSAVSSDVVKSLIFFASFLVVYYLIVSVVHRPSDIAFVANTMVIGGIVLAVFGVVESRTGYNFFNHLSQFLPFIQFTGSTETLARGGRLRIMGSAQHPIAFGAALVMLVPLAVYRAQVTGRRLWWGGVFLLVLGALASGSRTAVTMLFAAVIVYLVFQAKQMKRLWPALLPALLVIHFAIPGTLGETFQAFFPKGGIVAQQQDAPVGSARLSTLGPVLHKEVAPDALFGEGFATRITTRTPTTPIPNAPITDDQWLASLAETGIAGVGALLWLFVRFFRRMRAAARGDRSARAPLLTAAAASVSAFAVGMFTYDAFSFIQVNLIMFILLALGTAALAAPRDQWKLLGPSSV